MQTGEPKLISKSGSDGQPTWLFTLSRSISSGLYLTKYLMVDAKLSTPTQQVSDRV